MAMGKPIITTNFEAVFEFKDIISIAKSKEEFTRLVEDALNKDEKKFSLKRKHIASQNTWEKKVNEISELIDMRIRALQKN